MFLTSITQQRQATAMLMLFREDNAQRIVHIAARWNESKLQYREPLVGEDCSADEISKSQNRTKSSEGRKCL